MSEQAALPAESAIAFGPFRLLRAQRCLLEGDRALRLSPRALDLLTALVERPGEAIGKDELIARVWPNTFVEEGNLRVHVAALRKTLGDGRAGQRYLDTIPGRGYCFVAPVTRVAVAQPQTPAPAPPVGAHNLPIGLTRTVGRDDTVRRLTARLASERLITIVGTGGIGKTTLALSVAEAMISTYGDGVRFVDLAPLGDPQLVPSALASVLGLETYAENLLPGLVAILRDRHMLLVLDNCEHVLKAVSTLVVEVLRSAPRVHILATSREALRADGERTSRLAPLENAPPSTTLGAAEALRFPAVQLFVERAAATLDGFELSDAEAPLVVDICRKLDGIALAIELAAARVDVFGVRGVAERLSDRLRLLTRGRRSARARHQTMQAALDWSYESLDDVERGVLRHLAIFAGGFTLDAARGVSAAAEADDDVADRIGDLVAKSLVVADLGGDTVHYRLFETTRAYSLEKLKASGELDSAARRHAAYYRDLFEQSARETEGPPTPELMADYGSRNDNVRAALDWAFSPSGDPAIGLALTVASVPLWFQLSLVEECRARIERALAHVSSGPSKDARLEMKLCIALGTSLFDTTGPVHDTSETWTRALDLATGLADTEYQLRALWGLWASRLNAGDYRTTQTLAQRFCSLAADKAEPADLCVGDRMMAVSLHHLGHQPEARRHIESMLARPSESVNRWQAIRFVLDQRVAGRALLAQILWLQGFPDQAMEAAQRSVEEARTIGHAVSLCHALAQGACSVALLSGDLAATERFVALLLEHSATQALAIWQARGRCFEGALLIRRGDLDRGLPHLRDALEGLRETRFATLFGGMLAEGLGHAGQVRPALDTVETAIARSERDAELWCLPELLRIKAELLLATREPDAPASAERLLQTALDQAGEQGALSWQLRAAISLARQQHGGAGADKARDAVAELSSRFSEGWGTRDLQAAKQLLERSS